MLIRYASSSYSHHAIYMSPEYIARSLVETDTQSQDYKYGPLLSSEPHEYVLLARLPPLSRLLADAQQEAITAGQHAIIGASVTEAFEDILDVPPSPPTSSAALPIKRRASEIRANIQRAVTGVSAAQGASKARRRNWESHDVYRAIE